MRKKGFPKHKFKSGTVALREIRKLQRTTKNIIPLQPFRRLVYEIIQDKEQPLKFSQDAVLALRDGAEMYLQDLFKDSQRCAIHAGRQELQPPDVRLALSLGPQLHN